MELPDYMLTAPPPPLVGKNDLRLVQEREKINNFQKHFEDGLKSGHLTPSPYSYKHCFTDIHSEFGAALYGREMHLTKGTIIIGKIHKHPALNVLLKGKIAVVTEDGSKVLEAPCVFPSEPGVKRVGHVLEDCIFLNVLMTKHVGEENIEEAVKDHVADSYQDIGLVDSVEKLRQINNTVT